MTEYQSLIERLQNCNRADEALTLCKEAAVAIECLQQGGQKEPSVKTEEQQSVGVSGYPTGHPASKPEE